MKPEEPPSLEAVHAVGVEGLISLGEKVFKGKGACALCHNAAGRAPLLDNIMEAANTRIASIDYHGSAKTAEEYIRESLASPSAYVVPGYGMAGDELTSPMPDVTTGAIGLSAQEVDSVIAYLQRLSGVDVTVTGEAGGIDVSGAIEATTDSEGAR
ncbi:MAG: c-type cytochrome [Deltaproteobacteria bacterium]|nr:c-type cytochrome [Deltaproteobacteria bacterium]